MAEICLRMATTHWKLDVVDRLGPSSKALFSGCSQSLDGGLFAASQGAVQGRRRACPISHVARAAVNRLADSSD